MRDRLPRLIQANANSVASGALVIAMLVSAAVLLYAGRDQTIRGDGLGYAARLAGEPLGHALLHPPPNKYLIAIPLLLYDGMFNAFGLGADLPYRLVVTGFVLLSAGLFFVLARRRVGSPLALAPTCLLLLFGSSWEPLITYLRMPSLVAVATGLGALVVLERRDRRGDIAAAVFLSSSVASHPVGLAFLAAAGVIVVLYAPGCGWRRIWLVGPAVAIFGSWWLFLYETTPSLVPTSATDVVTFVGQSWTTIAADITGLAGVVGDPSFQQVPAKILALALLGLAIAVVLKCLPGVPPTLWGAVAGLLVLFASTRLAPQGFLRRPDDVRYLYPAAVFFLWLLIEVLGLINPRALVAWAVVAVIGLGVAHNLAQLSDGSTIARLDSEAARGQYAAYELAGDRVDPNYQVAAIVYPSAGDYLRAAAAYGSAAEPIGELPTASLTTRQAADGALAGSLGIALQAVSRNPGLAGTPPEVKLMLSGRSRRIRNCLRLLPGPPEPGSPRVPVNPRPSYREALARALKHQPVPTVPELAVLGPLRGGLVIRADHIGGVAALTGMFLFPPSAQVDQLPRGNTALLYLPAAALPKPWEVTLAANQPITACPIG